MEDQLKPTLKQSLFDKIHDCVSSELNKMGVDYVEHKETMIIAKGEFKGLSIVIKVEVK